MGGGGRSARLYRRCFCGPVWVCPLRNDGRGNTVPTPQSWRCCAAGRRQLGNGRAWIKSGAEALAANLSACTPPRLGSNGSERTSPEKGDRRGGMVQGKDPAKGTTVVREGKNWYAVADDCEITVNARSFTIITAHSAKGPPRGPLPLRRRGRIKAL